MHVRHILVAVDLTPLSERAVDEAIRWTLAFRGEITRVTLFHVDETPSLAIGNATSVLDLMTKVAHARSEHLGHLAKRLSETGVEVGVEVAAGLPHEEILSAITRLSADWLVIARRKNGEEGSFLLGSTTKRLLRKITCPVLVCNGLPADQTANIDHTKLIVTTDFSDHSVYGLQEAADLSQRLNASLTVVHALNLPILVPFLPGEFPLQIPQDSLVHISAIQQGELDTWTKTNAPRQTLNTRLVIGTNIADSISDFALSQHAGLIIVAAQGKGAFASFFLGSTTQSLAERVPCAVLVLPSQAQHAA